MCVLNGSTSNESSGKAAAGISLVELLYVVCLLRLGGLGVLCMGRPVWGSIHCMGICLLLGSRIPSNALPDPERLRRVAGLCSGVDGEDSIVLGRVTGGAASDEPLRRVTTDIACAVVLEEGPLPRLTGTSSGEDLDRSPGDHQAGKTLYGSPWFFLATRRVLTTPAPCGRCCVVKNECTERKLFA